MADEYQRFWINCAESVGREWLLAEAFEAGAGGAEEKEEGGRFRACIYVSPDRIEAVRRVLCEIAPPTTSSARLRPQLKWTGARRGRRGSKLFRFPPGFSYVRLLSR